MMIKRLFLAALAVLLTSTAVLAQTPIPSLPAASGVNGTDLMALSQSATTRKATVTQLATFIGAGTLSPPVTNAELATMPTQTIKCNAAGGTAVPTDCSAATVNAFLGSVGGPAASLTPGATIGLTGSVTATGVLFTGAGNINLSTVLASGAAAANLVGGTLTGTGSGLALLTLSDTSNGNGVGLLFNGNGGTTPSKTIRVEAGHFQIINSAYSAVALDLSDAGTMTVTGSFGAAGLNSSAGLSVTAGAVTLPAASIAVAALPFTPVQQGGGTSQGNNKVFLGWDSTSLRAQVDATDLGDICFSSSIVNQCVKSFNTRTGAVTLSSGDVTTALGFTPASVSDSRFGGPTQNSLSGVNYTLVLSDAGGQLYHPAADTTPRSWVIPANSSVPFPIGTKIDLVNDTSAGAITLSITTDTMVWFPAATTGTRVLAASAEATLTKITATRWVITGVGISFLMLAPLYRRPDNDDEETGLAA